MVPDFQTIILPLLKYIGDEKEYYIREVADALSKEFNLSNEDRKKLLPSGKQPIFYNRVGWARTYLAKAGLLEKSSTRGYFKITERGKEVLKKNPSKINRKLLEQFEEFREFKKISKTQTPEPQKNDPESSTPQELIEMGHQKIQKELASELLSQLKKCSSSFFEKLVVDLLLAMGYGGSREDAGKAIGKSGDEGIDGTIKEDKLGLDVVYIQAKRWTDTTISRSEIQKFVGALVGKNARKGVFITTSEFSKNAVEYISKIDRNIVLIDGYNLSNLMIENNIGVSILASYEIKKIDLDYFIEN